MHILTGRHRKNVANIKNAREHLEQSISERPEVEALAAELHKAAVTNNFTKRVDASLRGRRYP